MKIKRSVLEKMIREELANHIMEIMTEAPEASNREDNLVDAESDGKKEKSAKPEKKVDVKKEPDKNKPVVSKEKELPVEDDPVDPEIEKDVEKDADETEDAEEVTGGKIADELSGKTIQSVTMEPKSKTLPGAQEIVLTFREIQDPLKILVLKTGQVKFFFRGLHNEV